MKAEDIKKRDDLELQKELIALRKLQFTLRMQIAAQQLSDTSQIGKTRKDIARIKTMQHERMLSK
jgi:large subunit ribosomal protein L29